MKASMIMLLGATLAGTAAQGHDLPVPGEDWSEWALVDEGPAGSLFIADVERVGQSASFLLMEVSRDAAPSRFSHDGETRAILADCSSRQYEVTAWVLARNAKPFTPMAVRMPAPRPGVTPPTPEQLEASDHEAPPVAGSREHRALQMACGEAALPAETIADPYRWARQRFGLKTPPPKKPR